MSNVTRAQLEAQLNNVDRLARRAGIIKTGDQMALVAGGSTTGVQVWLIQEGQSGYTRAPFAPSGGIIGLTRTEASRALDIVRATLEAVTL